MVTRACFPMEWPTEQMIPTRVCMIPPVWCQMIRFRSPSGCRHVARPSSPLFARSLFDLWLCLVLDEVCSVSRRVRQRHGLVCLMRPTVWLCEAEMLVLRSLRRSAALFERATPRTPARIQLEVSFSIGPLLRRKGLPFQTYTRLSGLMHTLHMNSCD